MRPFKIETKSEFEKFLTAATTTIIIIIKIIISLGYLYHLYLDNFIKTPKDN